MGVLWDNVSHAGGNAIVYGMRLKKSAPLQKSEFLLGTYGYIRFPISITKLVFFEARLSFCAFCAKLLCGLLVICLRFDIIDPGVMREIWRDLCTAELYLGLLRPGLLLRRPKYV